MAFMSRRTFCCSSHYFASGKKQRIRVSNIISIVHAWFDYNHGVECDIITTHGWEFTWTHFNCYESKHTIYSYKLTQIHYVVHVFICCTYSELIMIWTLSMYPLSGSSILDIMQTCNNMSMNISENSIDKSDFVFLYAAIDQSFFFLFFQSTQRIAKMVKLYGIPNGMSSDINFFYLFTSFIRAWGEKNTEWIS